MGFPHISGREASLWATTQPTASGSRRWSRSFYGRLSTTPTILLIGLCSNGVTRSVVDGIRWGFVGLRCETPVHQLLTQAPTSPADGMVWTTLPLGGGVGLLCKINFGLKQRVAEEFIEPCPIRAQNANRLSIISVALELEDLGLGPVHVFDAAERRNWGHPLQKNLIVKPKHLQERIPFCPVLTILAYPQPPPVSVGVSLRFDCSLLVCQNGRAEFYICVIFHRKRDSEDPADKMFSLMNTPSSVTSDLHHITSRFFSNIWKSGLPKICLFLVTMTTSGTSYASW